MASVHCICISRTFLCAGLFMYIFYLALVIFIRSTHSYSHCPTPSSSSSSLDPGSLSPPTPSPSPVCRHQYASCHFIFLNAPHGFQFRETSGPKVLLPKCPYYIYTHRENTTEISHQ